MLITISFILSIIASIVYCIAPAFVALHVEQNPLGLMFSFLIAGPFFFTLVQLIHTFTLVLLGRAFGMKLNYGYFMGLIHFQGKFRFRFHFAQFLGLLPAVSFSLQNKKRFPLFFVIYHLTLLLFLAVYYIAFRYLWPNPLLLPLISFSLLVIAIQHLYSPAYQQLFWLKSQVLTCLEIDDADDFSVSDYQMLWDLGPNNDVSTIALCYLAFLKNDLSKLEVDKIEVIEDLFMEQIHTQRALYGMLDVIKINLYLYREGPLYARYQALLNELSMGRPNWAWLLADIKAALDGHKKLSISLAIQELELLLEKYE